MDVLTGCICSHQCTKLLRVSFSYLGKYQLSYIGCYYYYLQTLLQSKNAKKCQNTPKKRFQNLRRSNPLEDQINRASFYQFEVQSITNKAITEFRRQNGILNTTSQKPSFHLQLSHT
uniref:Uncharacterized protein n=1 Tax=Rhizophora mucronata TaxID=61149 RepID=A0A2P2JTK6_RHIMU